MKLKRVDWHHAPEHRFLPGSTFLVTAATLYKKHFFQAQEALQFLEDCLLQEALDLGWVLEAWAVFSNHYHFIGRALSGADPLSRFLQVVHSKSARWINELDKAPGRKAWYQYWDRCLTFEYSYYARLNYVNQNAVKHGLVSIASNYPYCSVGIYEAEVSSVLRRKLASYGFDRINERDEFEPVWI